MGVEVNTNCIKPALSLLWGDEENMLTVAKILYRSPREVPLALEGEQNWAVQTFLTFLQQEAPQKPKDNLRRWEVVTSAITRTIIQAESNSSSLLLSLMVTLFPALYVADPKLAETLCQALVMLYHKEAFFLSPKPQVYWLEWTFRHALLTQHPQDLTVLWQLLDADDPIAREAARCALQWLRAVHATTHLLFGLYYVKNHALRMNVVSMLEEIAEPQVLMALARLHRETAETDWPLSRRIARAVHIIAQQNATPNPLTLLRPADPPDSFADLLHPAISGTDGGKEASRTELLRSAIEPSGNEKTP